MWLFFQEVLDLGSRSQSKRVMSEYIQVLGALIGSDTLHRKPLKLSRS